mmetsp:Transcript_48420/g.90733  ORF Transcript_48420/g.90733 Transcript_48420/m.90733 type:complete len:159 (-) Transcript_48420:55-531(-)
MSRLRYLSWRCFAASLLFLPCRGDGGFGPVTTTTESTTTVSRVASDYCLDTPEGWVSSDLTTCCRYYVKDFCTQDGGYGAGWLTSYGVFDDWARDGISALDACCVCGGGTNTGCGGAGNTCLELDYSWLADCDDARSVGTRIPFLATLACLLYYAAPC